MEMIKKEYMYNSNFRRYVDEFCRSKKCSVDEALQNDQVRNMFWRHWGIEIMFIKLKTIDDVKEFVNICSKYDVDIDVKQGKFTVDGKSILGIFSLNLIEGLSVYILTPDEKVAEDFKRKIFKWNVS